MSEITGGCLVAHMLQAEGVDTIFGIIDSSYFGMYSSFSDTGIRMITPRHESSGLHMAGVYSRATGGLGVAMASNGPGVANCLPGIPVEQGEGHRVLLITATRRTGVSYPQRQGAFQYFDQSGAIAKMAKFSEYVPTHERLPEMLRAAKAPLIHTGLGDVRLFLAELAVELQSGPAISQQPDTWSDLVKKADEKLHKKAVHKISRGVNSGRVPAITQEIAPADTLWVLDGGNTAVWGHFYTRARTVNSIFTRPAREAPGFIRGEVRASAGIRRFFGSRRIA